MINTNVKRGLNEYIDLTIQKCPIDYRKKLYSGGPTHINSFDKRVNISIQKRVNDRLNKFEKIEKIEICIKDVFQKNVGWLGGSYFSSGSDFISLTYTKEEYFEKGS